LETTRTRRLIRDNLVDLTRKLALTGPFRKRFWPSLTSASRRKRETLSRTYPLCCPSKVLGPCRRVDESERRNHQVHSKDEAISSNLGEEQSTTVSPPISVGVGSGSHGSGAEHLTFLPLVNKRALRKLYDRSAARQDGSSWRWSTNNPYGHRSEIGTHAIRIPATIFDTHS
jgi:hypothetical protein